MKKIVMVASLISALGTGQAFCSSYDDLNAGIHLHNLRQWSASIAAFDKALAAGDLLRSQQFLAHMDRGLAHQAQLDYELALADYSACLALQPKNATALSERATVYMETGKLAEAAVDLDALIALRPMLASAYTIRAAIDARLGKTGQSVADSKKVLALLPGDYVRNIGTGIVAWQADEPNVAEENFTYAASQGSGNVYAWLWLALTKVRMGKTVPNENPPGSDNKSWPAPIIDFFTGGTTQDAVFTAAGEGEDALTRGRICEANFYVGEWRLQHHDPAAAQPMIRKAADDCPMDFVEWSPAQIAIAGFAR